jgi:DNA polymerase-3 subunit alpha
MDIRFCQMISFSALEKIIENKTEEEKKIYRERLEHEYDIIHSLGFDDYFLVFDDIVKNVEGANFMVRGSSIGSLMTYTLGLSNTDPIEYGLLFERFLNKSRASRSEYPDIDLETDKTEEIQEYLRKKYGEDGAFLMTDKVSVRSKSSIMYIKNALSDSFENEENKKLFTSACFDLYDPIRLKKYYKAGENSLKEEIKKYPEFMSIINKSSYHVGITKLAFRIEEQVTGFKKSPSSYVLIPKSKRKLYSESMLSPKSKDDTASLKTLEMSKHTVSLLGLVKLDILSNNVLGRLNLLLKNRNDIKVDSSMTDENSYKVLTKGLTFGIFQLSNQSKLCSAVKPKNFEDLVSIMALMRPGISQETKKVYFDNRRGGRKVDIHPIINEILEPTHGAILYDEQIMLIAQKVAGYSPDESDNIRSLLKGNKKDKLHLMKEEFIAGGIKNGVDEKSMEKVFNTIEQMCGKYTFNKAHAIAYAKVAYQQASIAYYYPAEYFSSFVLDGDNNEYEPKEIISQLKSLNGFSLRFPKPNEVFNSFKSIHENNKITGIVPLSHLVSVNTYHAIETARSERQFQSFQDFVKRSLQTVMNAKSSYSFEIKEKKRETIFNAYVKDIESLIKIGVFDHVVKSQEELSVLDKRQALTENLNDLIKHLKEPYLYNYDPVVNKSKNELKLDVSSIITEETKFLFGESPTAEWIKNNKGSYLTEENKKNEERIQKRRERAALIAIEKSSTAGNIFFDKASKIVEEQKKQENSYSIPKYK